VDLSRPSPGETDRFAQDVVLAKNVDQRGVVSAAWLEDQQTAYLSLEILDVHRR
jgi:hypothetical protein